MERLDRKNGSVYIRRLGSSCSHVCKVINFPNLKNIRSHQEHELRYELYLLYQDMNVRHQISSFISAVAGGVGRAAESWDKVVTTTQRIKFNQSSIEFFSRHKSEFYLYF